MKTLTLENGLDETRRLLLRSRGLFVARLPAPEVREDGDFHWIVDPLPKIGAYTDAVWYCDGSMLNGKWKAMRVAGFGIVVTTREGQLLGFGVGAPPSEFTTAAAD